LIDLQITGEIRIPEILTLVPYATTKLRITAFPQLKS
jgi:hypothetical protein